MFEYFHQDIRATLSQYLRNPREMRALYDNISAIRCGYKICNFAIFRDDIFIDDNPNYYIGCKFYDIYEYGITIIKNIYKYENYYKSNDILWYIITGIRITNKYTYMRNLYINIIYGFIIRIENLSRYGYISIDDTIIYNPQIYKMLQNGEQLYKSRYREIMNKIKK